eukprot:m.310547 g.310547  ORF g.310547 m.310547 type:complete len:500 (+) comp52458_c0_seq1:394-1893(+)
MSRDYEDTKFHEGARFGDLDLIRAAINESIDINAIGLYEWTALHEAVVNEEHEIVKVLLQNGANPNVRDLINGTTPLHLCAKQGSREILKCLLDHQADPTLLDDDGQRASDLAADPWCKHILERELAGTVTSGSGKGPHGPIARASSRLHVVLPDSLENEGADSVPEVCLSFEYNEKTARLKVRVRKIKKIAIPKDDLLAASSIYVKGHLSVPAAQQTPQVKSKTEDIPVTEVMKAEEYVPEIEFSTPLTYSKVNNIHSTHQILAIGIYYRIGWPLSQSVGLASMSLPLESAVKIIMPTWFGLQPTVRRALKPAQPRTKVMKAWSNDSQKSLRKNNSTQSFWNVSAIKDTLPDFSWNIQKDLIPEKEPPAVITVAPKPVSVNEFDSRKDVSSAIAVYRRGNDPFAGVATSKNAMAERVILSGIKTRQSAELIDLSSSENVMPAASPPRIKKKGSATIIDIETDEVVGRAVLPGFVDSASSPSSDASSKNRPAMHRNGWT